MKLTTAVLCLLCVPLALGGEFVTESARKIPVAYDVDVVVVGGSTGAVAAATAAAEQGAKVFLAAPHPYLGDDMTATLRLWLEEGETLTTPLAQRLFSEQHAAPPIPDAANLLPLTYQASKPSAGRHKDTRRPSLLTDGKWGTAAGESVEYPGDVTVTADLHKVADLANAYLLLYHHKDYKVARVTVEASTDGETWRKVRTIENEHPGLGDDHVPALVLSTPVEGKARYVRFHVEREEEMTRVLLAEILVTSKEPQAGKAPEAEPAGAPPATPLHVKRVLDDELIAAGVQFLYSCYPTDVLRDSEGGPAGIVMANRAGRQAVVAKTIIDATPRAVVARMAGAKAKPFPPGVHTVKRVVIGGEVQEAKGMTARTIEPAFHRGSKRFPIIEYTLRLPFRDASYGSWAAAEQMARDKTYHEGQQFTSDELFMVPPDLIQGAGDGKLGPFRAAGLPNVYVLGGCADLPREQAAKLLRPDPLIQAGTAVGEAAAAQAEGAAKPQGVKLAGPTRPAAARGDVREFLRGVRAFQELPTVPQAERSVPVVGRYDVVVIGGGTGGAPAGIAAARQGAKTLVVEMLHGLGGVGTHGLISKYYWGNRVGFTKEVAPDSSWWPEQKMEMWRRKLREAGADIWFGTVGCGAFVRDGDVRGAVVATPFGRGVVLADVVIDSTGNADIAAAAGARVRYTDNSFIALQGTGLPPRRLGASYTNTDYTIVDETDMLDVWHVMVYAKKQAGKAFDLGQLVDTRERRRIVGEETISILDAVNQRTYPDTICQAYTNFDTHGYTVHPFFLLQMPHKRGMHTNIPYRALVPKGLDGMLVTGLGISAHRDA
ncbi:MAG: FAD-dependent oxidoreductase, partial [Planctomycetota bacterium]